VAGFHIFGSSRLKIDDALPHPRPSTHRLSASHVRIRALDFFSRGIADETYARDRLNGIPVSQRRRKGRGGRTLFVKRRGSKSIVCSDFRCRAARCHKY
jgi:hypothetical protein